MRIMKNGLMEWDRQEIPEEEIRGRVKAVQKRMAQEKLDALIIFSEVSESGAVGYFSNLAVFANRAILILSGTGDGTLITSLGWRDAEWAKTTLLTEDIRPGANLTTDCSTVLKELGLKNNRVGIVEWNLFPYTTYSDLKSSLPGLELIDATNLVNELRLVKSPVEINLIEKAANIANKAWERSIVDWQYQKECELAAQIELHARRLACQDIFTFVTSNGESSLWLHPPTEKNLGKEISVEIMAQYKHYWGAMGRTIIPDGPDKDSMSLQETGEKAYSEAVQNLKEGQSIQDILDTMGRAIKIDTIKILANASFGFGMVSLDRAWMNDSKYKDIILKENMEVILQLGLVDKAKGHTFLIEDTFIVKKGKSIKLTG